MLDERAGGTRPGGGQDLAAGGEQLVACFELEGQVVVGELEHGASVAPTAGGMHGVLQRLS